MGKKTGKRLLWVWFALYGALMLWLLFGRTGVDYGENYWEQVGQNLNLVPFRTVALYIRLLKRTENRYLLTHAIVNLAGNVVMFIPLGYFLPALFPRLGKLWKSLLCTAAVIVAVETVQLFTLVGSCDVDDLLLNLLGAGLGYGLFRLINRTKKT